MTTELEKQFFETFGIKPHKTPSREYDSDGKICSYYIEYPPITDRHYLELMLIIMYNEDYFGYPISVDELKENTLEKLMETYSKFSNCITCDGEYQQAAKELKHQVQELFKE